MIILRGIFIPFGCNRQRIITFFLHLIAFIIPNYSAFNDNKALLLGRPSATCGLSQAAAAQLLGVFCGPVGMAEPWGAAACAHRAGLSWVLGQPASLQPMVGRSFRFFWSELDVGNPLPPAACLLPRWASPCAAGSLAAAPAAAAPSLCFPRLSKNAISGGLLQIFSKGTCVVRALFSKAL